MLDGLDVRGLLDTLDVVLLPHAHLLEFGLLQFLEAQSSHVVITVQSCDGLMVWVYVSLVVVSSGRQEAARQLVKLALLDHIWFKLFLHRPRDWLTFELRQCKLAS